MLPCETPHFSGWGGDKVPSTSTIKTQSPEFGWENVMIHSVKCLLKIPCITIRALSASSLSPVIHVSAAERPDRLITCHDDNTLCACVCVHLELSTK